MDLLTDVLAVSGVRGTLGSRLEAGGRWGLSLDDFPGAALHVVTAGTAWLGVPGHPPTELAAGDVVLLPAGTHHGLSDEQDTAGGPCDRAAADLARRTGEVVRLGDGPVRTRIVTLHYDHDSTVKTHVLSVLPDVVHVGADAGARRLADTVRLLAGELSDPQVATTAVLNSLVDVLLIQLLRAWLETQPAEQRESKLGVLSDPIVREALLAFHREPARPWTTATLAAAVPVSRATLSRRFPAATGQTPAAYIADWRMDLAAVHLRDTSDPVEVIAAAVGYASAPAFSRAFHRARGQAPGQYRESARSTA